MSAPPTMSINVKLLDLKQVQEIIASAQQRITEVVAECAVRSKSQEALGARVATLEAALAPFAKLGAEFADAVPDIISVVKAGSFPITVGDFRRARGALLQGEGEPR